ncbi:hypothetical protein ACWEYS_13630 [Staphylococcus xylosus]|nr:MULTISPECIES: hypothetical protein [Staphylococcus]
MENVFKVVLNCLIAGFIMILINGVSPLIALINPIVILLTSLTTAI